MKKTDFTKEKDADLMKTFAEKREALRAFRFGTAGSTTRDVKALHINKKDVARILTELKARSHRA
jgi:ribosomal protein L29